MLFVQETHTHMYTKAQHCTNSSSGHKYRGKIAPRSNNPQKIHDANEVRLPYFQGTHPF